MSLLGEAAVGAVFGELLNAVLEIKDKAVMFKQNLVYLDSTLKLIDPVIKEMEKHNNKLGRPKEELESLIGEMEEGTKLVCKCSKIHWLNFVARIRYQNKLEALVESLERFFNINVQAQIARDQKETLLKVTRIHSTVNKLPLNTVGASSDSNPVPGEVIQISENTVEAVSRGLSCDSNPTSMEVNESSSDTPFSTQHVEDAFGANSSEHQVEQERKCYMLSAKNLFIEWGDNPDYWRWTSVPDARFTEVAELVRVCWLEIRGWIKTSMLPPNTRYEAFFVFKRSDNVFGFKNQAIEASIKVVGKGNDGQRRTVFLEAATRPTPREPSDATTLPLSPEPLFLEVEYATERADGWMEIQLGEFFNGNREDKEVEMCLCENKHLHWKGGILVQGIEIRPKLEKL